MLLQMQWQGCNAAILIAIPPAGVHFRLVAGRAFRSYSVHSIR
jgi:hypothetical protein